MQPDAIHWMLLREAMRVELPKAYTRDVSFHDRNLLAETLTQRFLYALRESGSHLIPLDTSRTVDESSPYSIVKAVGSNYCDGVRWYLFSHGELSPISQEHALRVASQG